MEMDGLYAAFHESTGGFRAQRAAYEAAWEAYIVRIPGGTPGWSHLTESLGTNVRAYLTLLEVTRHWESVLAALDEVIGDPPPA